ncbi:cinnamoyl-CoA reductase 2-like [Asparagus officinalis]|uniref:cinnamoyl-CoA reductase 2-like n=1 Tax=Asparagus officinalis TaxID=4686 RepID=UPI00098E08BF|nr:cinnamoyl-CoA reductase 2-like [Asparagus officinalis]
MEKESAEKRRVCVTGAGGFIASWLVKLLLSKGYMVHGTVRDPSDEKNAHLKNLDGALENLQLFKADLLDYNAVAAAIAGCEGVFHVASPVPPTKVLNPEVELLAPAVEGTLIVLKVCSEVKVKRVIVVSSVVSVLMNPKWPKDKVMDEECWSDSEYCRTTENWYCLSKTIAETEALEYARKHELDVVTVCPSMVLGPLLQSKVNSSSLFLINILKGNPESMENRSLHYVDVRDVADSLLLVYEKPEASGRYVCAPHPLKMLDLVNMLKEKFPVYEYPKKFIEVEDRPLMSSEKLKRLGWKVRPLKETLVDTVECYEKAGLLNTGITSDLYI